MSVKAVSSDKYVFEAEKAVAQTKKEVCSSHDIIPRTELGNHAVNQHQHYYQQYGFRYIRFLSHTILYQKDENACRAAIRKIWNELKFPSSAFAIAMTKFGRGECQAVMNLTAAKLRHLNPLAFLLTSDKGGKDPAEHQEFDGHTLLMLGLSMSTVKAAAGKAGTNQLTKIFDGLKESGGVIVDPFLGCVSPIVEYLKKAQVLLEYNKMYGTHYLMRYAEFDWSAEKCATILEEADRIYKLASSTFLGTPSASPEVVVMQKMNEDKLSKLLDAHVLPQTLASVNALFPKLSWKTTVDLSKDKAEWAVWMRGSKEEAKPVLETFQGLSFKVSVRKVQQSTDVAVILQNPNPSDPKLRELHIRATRLYPVAVAQLISAYAAD